MVSAQSDKKRCSYVIYGSPLPLQRPRYSSNKVYDAQKQIKLLYGIELSNQHNDQPLLKGPLHLDITFFFESSKMHKAHKYHTFKPDLSNLIKLIEDVANEVLYKDDALISVITAHKVYDEKPRTEFTLQELVNEYK